MRPPAAAASLTCDVPGFRFFPGVTYVSSRSLLASSQLANSPAGLAALCGRLSGCRAFDSLGNVYATVQGPRVAVHSTVQASWGSCQGLYTATMLEAWDVSTTGEQRTARCWCALIMLASTCIISSAGVMPEMTQCQHMPTRKEARRTAVVIWMSSQRTWPHHRPSWSLQACTLSRTPRRPVPCRPLSGCCLSTAITSQAPHLLPPPAAATAQANAVDTRWVP
jgi:hypothetical protein